MLYCRKSTNTWWPLPTEIWAKTSNKCERTSESLMLFCVFVVIFSWCGRQAIESAVPSMCVTTWTCGEWSGLKLSIWSATTLHRMFLLVSKYNSENRDKNYNLRISYFSTVTTCCVCLKRGTWEILHIRACLQCQGEFCRCEKIV